MSWRNNLISLIIRPLNSVKDLFSRSNPSGYEILKSKSLDYSSGVSELPSVLILEILLKLPLQIIIRCRCVCKTWNNLISEKYFAKVYFKNPPCTILVKPNYCKVGGQLFHDSFYFLEIGLNFDIKRTSLFRLKTRRIGILKTMGSCNGLLCYVQIPPCEDLSNKNGDYEVVYVINVLLGEVTMLPQVNMSKNTSIVAYGFGFSDHYKVLRIVRRDHSGNECDIHGEIFTIGVDRKWRSFDDSSLAYMLSPCGIFLDGILYFVGYHTSGFLLAFDMEEERGRRITLPSELEGTPCNNIVLAVCNDNLCLSDKTDPHQLNIWTMKRDGVVESWSKEIILKLWISHGLLYLITTLKNGDLLMNWYPMVGYSDGLLSYNRKTKKCSKLQYTGISFPWEDLFLSPIVLCRAEP